MRTVLARVSHGRAISFIAAAMLLGAGLAACGSSSGASATATATATPNCTRTRTAQSVTGTITAVSANGFQVTSASGQVTSVQLAATTRITRTVTAMVASLTSGTSILVTPDTTGSTAVRIVITPQGAGGFGGGSGSGARGTPPAGFNPACLGTRTPGQGPFQGGQGSGAGTRGTVTSASSVHVVLTDASGETLAFAITPTTEILTTAAGTPSDLTQGSKVTVSGTRSGSALVARTIMLQAPAASS